jgi:hypothetical protein
MALQLGILIASVKLNASPQEGRCKPATAFQEATRLTPPKVTRAGNPLSVKASLDRTRGGLPMNVEMILAGTRFAGIALSFMILLRARRLSVGLWSTASFYQRSPVSSGVTQSIEIDQIFRA